MKKLFSRKSLKAEIKTLRFQNNRLETRLEDLEKFSENLLLKLAEYDKTAKDILAIKDSFYLSADVDRSTGSRDNWDAIALFSVKTRDNKLNFVNSIRISRTSAYELKKIMEGVIKNFSEKNVFIDEPFGIFNRRW